MMTDDNFEKLISDKLQNHSVEPSAEVMKQVFAKRSRTHIFLNHLRLNRIAYTSAAIVLAAVLLWTYNSSENNQAAAGVAAEPNRQYTGTNADQGKSRAELHTGTEKTSALQPEYTTAESNSGTGQAGARRNRRHRPGASLAANTASQHYNTSEVFRAPVVQATTNYEKQVGLGFKKLSPSDQLYIRNSVNIDDIYSPALFNYLKYKQFVRFYNSVPAPEAGSALAVQMNRQAKTITNAHKPLFIDVLYAPYFGKKQYTDAGAVTQGVDLSYRYTSSLGLRLSYPLYKGLMIQAGINHTGISEDYYYHSGAEKIRVDTIKQYIVDPAGPVIVKTTYDTVRYRTGDAYAKNVQQQYSLPVGLSQVFNLNDRLDFSVNAGVIVNIASSGKGMRYESGSENNNSYKTATASDFSLGYYFGGTFSYMLAPRWSILAEPNFRRTRVAGVNNGIATAQQYSLYGAAFGLRYTW